MVTLPKFTSFENNAKATQIRQNAEAAKTFIEVGPIGACLYINNCISHIGRNYMNTRAPRTLWIPLKNGAGIPKNYTCTYMFLHQQFGLKCIQRSTQTDTC